MATNNDDGHKPGEPSKIHLGPSHETKKFNWLPWLLLALGLRAAVTWRAREPWWTVPLHPFTVLVALAIQWTALARWAVGLPPGWKGRAYPGTKAA